MRVLTCLISDHDPWLLVLAVILCVVGASAATTLIQQATVQKNASRLHWSFLAAVTAGASTWATHFIAMLSYRPNTHVSFDGALTIFSAIIAVVGIMIGLLFATMRRRSTATILSGSAVGLSIAAMHYIGMFAYRVDGIVQWLPEYVAASIALAMVFSTLAIARLCAANKVYAHIQGTIFLILAICTVHFVGMAAFVVTPIEGFQVGADSAAFNAMATGIAAVAFLIICVGGTARLVERRTLDQSEEQLHHLARHDALTRLANRHAFSEALQTECTRLHRYGRPFVLLLVDLDRFKPVNDTLGHPIGDEVLKRVAARLNHAVREGDLVARLGGDEFAIIAYGVQSDLQATALAERVVEVLSRPFAVNGNVAEISASVGIALAPEHGSEEADLIQHADIALYHAKREGRGRYALFETRLDEKAKRQRSLEAHLRRACMREDFTVVYQPVVDSVTGRIAGAEALLRWQCPDRGEITPGEFIPIAEEMGLICRIGAGVLRQACQDAASWPAEIDVSVNISPVQLLDPRLPQTVTQALDDAGLPASRLELEITETALLSDSDRALRTLTKLRDLGIRVSLDDFGTGYSSLSYLHRFPISRIKIDKSFVQRLPSDAGSASIVKAITQLGESLDIKITAEGIETNDQLAFIKSSGCNHIQGFLISKPIACADFAAWLQEHCGVSA